MKGVSRKVFQEMCVTKDALGMGDSFDRSCSVFTCKRTCRVGFLFFLFRIIRSVFLLARLDRGGGRFSCYYPVRLYSLYITHRRIVKTNVPCGPVCVCVCVCMCVCVVCVCVCLCVLFVCLLLFYLSLSLSLLSLSSLSLSLSLSLSSLSLLSLSLSLSLGVV